MPTTRAIRETIDFQGFAERALAGEFLSRDDAHAILTSPDEALPLLLNAAFSVRQHYFGKKVKLCMLMNIQSGLCSEDCHYCSQSSISNAQIDKYPLLEQEKMIAAAERAYAAKAKRFCMVASERGPTEKEIGILAAVSAEIKKRYPLEICCSLGITDEAKIDTLKKAGVDYINHNLNTSQAHYPAICTTHTYQDRVDTIQNVKNAGLSTCAGGIVGMGESLDDIIDMAFATREMEIQSIPVNFHHPIAGTPLEATDSVSPELGLKVLCLFRFLNPDKEIRAAGGRERKMGDRQFLVLYPANSIFIDGYLTTSGQSVEDAHAMIRGMGFEIEA